MQLTSVQKTKKIKEKLGGMNMFKKMKHIKNEKGLTLIELLAVIVILAIIAAIAIPAIGNIINNTRDKAVLSDVQGAVSAAKIAFADGSCGDAVSGVVTCTGDEFEFSSTKIDDITGGENVTVTFTNGAVTNIVTVLEADFSGTKIPGLLPTGSYVKADLKLTLNETQLNDVLD